MRQEYVRPQWIRGMFGDMLFFPGGHVPVGMCDTEEIEKHLKEQGVEYTKLSRRAYEMLKRWMVEKDPDRVVMTNRDEDLKVIHRLLDLLEVKPK